MADSRTQWLDASTTNATALNTRASGRHNQTGTKDWNVYCQRHSSKPGAWKRDTTTRKLDKASVWFQLTHG